MHQKLVVNTCYGLVQNREDAEDIAQDVFIEVFRNIEKFRADAKLSTWLYRIAVNRSLNHIRDNKKHKWFHSFGDEGGSKKQGSNAGEYPRKPTSRNMTWKNNSGQLF